MRGDTYRSIIAFTVILSLVVFSVALSTTTEGWAILLNPQYRGSDSVAASSPPPEPMPAVAPDEGETVVPEQPVAPPPPNPVPVDTSPPTKPIRNTNPSTKKIAYLTFDDGPSEEVTPIILGVLRDYKIKATFFVVGYHAEKHPDILKQIAAEGHKIGNHTYSHRIKVIYQDANILLDEIHSCDRAIADATGLHPKIFRAPGGSKPFLKPALASKLEEEEYQYFDWNVCPGDAVSKGLTAESMVRITLCQASNKSRIIVLLHDAYTMQQTAKALPGIIEGLQEQGFTFDVIDSDTVPIHF